MSDRQWNAVHQILQEHKSLHKWRSRLDELRRRYDGIFYVLQTRCPWRCLSPAYGEYQYINNLYADDMAAGIMPLIVDALAQHGGPVLSLRVGVGTSAGAKSVEL
ncbi:transposase [Sphingomonas abietis]|uniref:transposase n=1 Tax=Sphingomonas abietis TaxID=3012344 RepID=UPI00389AF1B8